MSLLSSLVFGLLPVTVDSMIAFEEMDGRMCMLVCAYVCHVFVGMHLSRSDNSSIEVHLQVCNAVSNSMSESMG